MDSPDMLRELTVHMTRPPKLDSDILVTLRTATSVLETFGEVVAVEHRDQHYASARSKPYRVKLRLAVEIEVE